MSEPFLPLRLRLCPRNGILAIRIARFCRPFLLFTLHLFVSVDMFDHTCDYGVLYLICTGLQLRWLMSLIPRAGVIPPTRVPIVLGRIRLIFLLLQHLNEREVCNVVMSLLSSPGANFVRLVVV